MCNTFSAICLPNGDLIFPAEYTDNHIDIIELKDLADNGRDLVKLECTPIDLRFDDLSSYVFKVDQPDLPSWWNEHIKQRAKETMMRRIGNMIVDDSRQILLGGCWILTGNARICLMKNSRIVLMTGSSRIEQMAGSSQIEQMTGSSRIGEDCRKVNNEE